MNIYFSHSNYKKAIEYAIMFNERSKDRRIDVYVKMGNSYEKIGKMGKAVKCYEKANELKIEYGMFIHDENVERAKKKAEGCKQKRLSKMKNKYND